VYVCRKMRYDLLMQLLDYRVKLVSINFYAILQIGQIA